MRKVCCQSFNLIYMIKCEVCNIQYVGQTKRPFLKRMYEHLRNIKIGADHSVARHFAVHGPIDTPPLSFQVLEFIHVDPNTDRAAFLRDVWICRLNCASPRGLNMIEPDYNTPQ